MKRKVVNESIRTLIEAGLKTGHRSMCFIIGDKSFDQIENLHIMLRNSVVRSKQTVLWCYRDKVEHSSQKNKRKRVNQLIKLLHRGIVDPERKVTDFSIFLEYGRITYCQYKDSERIIGKTFGMCILQDFEGLTPNLLGRTIEAVEGGGLIVLLLRSLSSLTSLCNMVVDVHKRFRTESHSEATGRFNERILLSLASCKACLVMDDELNIVPISSHMKSLTLVPVKEDSKGLPEVDQGLKSLKEQLNDDFTVGPMIKKCCTLGQAQGENLTVQQSEFMKTQEIHQETFLKDHLLQVQEMELQSMEVESVKEECRKNIETLNAIMEELRTMVR